MDKVHKHSAKTQNSIFSMISFTYSSKTNYIKNGPLHIMFNINGNPWNNTPEGCITHVVKLL